MATANATARLSAARRHPHGGELALLAAHDPDLAEELAADGGRGPLQRIRVRTGRHVDCVQLVFLGGTVETLGDAHGGEEQPSFELSLADREYVVRVNGRQKKHLDGIQFVTNLGRESAWFGGSGGDPFQMRAAAGSMVVGLRPDPAVEFCAPLLGIEESAALPAPARIWIWRLLLHVHVRGLVFSGKPSLFRSSLQGRPSVLWLMLRKRMILTRLMLRGRTSVARLLLDGEQQRSAPTSLLRRLCTASEDGAPSPMQLLNMRDKASSNNKTATEDPLNMRRSLLQLTLMGSPSVARQLFGKSSSPNVPLARLLFEGDAVNGFPSLMQLLTQRHAASAHFEEAPSVAEAMVAGEGVPGAQPSLLRLMLAGAPSIMNVLMAGEREGLPSLMRRMLTDRNDRGHSLARIVMTPINSHKGARPPLSVYVIPILQLLLAAEARPEQDSLMRLLCFTPPPPPSLLQRGLGGSSRRTANAALPDGASADSVEAQEARRAAERVMASFAAADARRAAGDDDDAEDDDNDAGRQQQSRKKPVSLAATRQAGGSTSKTGFGASLRNTLRVPGARRRERRARERRSLLDLLTSGKPSLAELMFEGELEGDESLARLMFGTTVEVSNGVLRLGAPIRTSSDAGLMHVLLAGEEPGGPGISAFRLLLVGERDSGMSVLRLLLLNEESESKSSVLRAMTSALKAGLTAAKTRPSHVRNGELREHFDKVKGALLGSQKEGASLRKQFEGFFDAFNPQSQFAALLGVLTEISQRGREFQDLWRAQFLRVAREIELAGQRARPGSLWNRMAPKWKRLAELVAAQNWPSFVSELALLAGTLDGVKQFTQRIEKITSASPPWLRLPTPRANRGRGKNEKGGGKNARSDDDFDDDEEDA